jgi:hypothetical protein
MMFLVELVSVLVVVRALVASEEWGTGNSPGKFD